MLTSQLRVNNCRHCTVLGRCTDFGYNRVSLIACSEEANTSSWALIGKSLRNSEVVVLAFSGCPACNHGLVVLGLPWSAVGKALAHRSPR